MDGFSYYNIFETKGMEYLIIIAFLALLIPFSLMLNRKVKIKRQLHKAMGILTSSVIRIPQGLFYSDSHTWAHLSRSGFANVGIDDLLVHLAGDVEVVFHKKPGDAVAKGEPMSEIKQGDKLLKLYSPVSGKIRESNELLTADPGILSEDPYGLGWLYKIKPGNWQEDTADCHMAEEANDWEQMELLRFRDFLAVSMPKYDPELSMATLQDGGELKDNILSELPNALWNDFQKEFLDSRA